MARTVVLGLLVLYGMICILMAKSTGINFNFPNFKACNTDGLLCINDSKVSDHAIQLTNDKFDMYKSTKQTTTGRVVYNENIQLSSIVNFSTHFQFTMNSSSYEGYGIAFFMSPKANASMALPRTYSYGLPIDEGSKLLVGVVAIEFDSSKDYVQLVSSNMSPVYHYLENDSMSDGKIWNAWIDYSSTTQQLEVVLSNHSTGSKIHERRALLSTMVNLSQYLPRYIVVGLSGKAYRQTYTIHSWSFNATTISPKSSPKKHSTTSTKIISVLGSILVVAIAGALLVWCYLAFKHRKKPHVNGQACTNSDIELQRLLEHGPHRFALEDLKAATGNFDEKEKLGSGGFGGVYRGLLSETKEIVAVKRIAEGSKQGIKEFITEITIVSRVRHRNLVQLLGWCHEKGQFLLVYEYMPNGSLDKHLFPKEDHPTLDWNRRYGIARDIASGLLYLHEEWGQCIVHRDVKSSNVILDCNFSAKLGDFGLARILKDDHLSQTTIAAGTLGYLAPECVMTGKTSPESDVYSFGAVALEIASGRRVVDLSLAEHNMRLVEWVWDLYGQGRVVDAADVRLNGEFETTEMEKLLEVGLWCSHPDAATRPKMRQVLKMLNFEAEVPQLPTALPIPSYAPIQAATLSASSSSSTPVLTDVPITSFEQSFASSKSNSISKGVLVHKRVEGR